MPAPKALNLNEQATRIADNEGKKVEVNIAQIKEIQRLVLEDLSECDPCEVMLTLHKVHEKKHGYA